MEKLHSEEQEGIILTSQLKPNNFIVIQRLPLFTPAKSIAAKNAPLGARAGVKTQKL